MSSRYQPNHKPNPRHRRAEDCRANPLKSPMVTALAVLVLVLLIAGAIYAIYINSAPSKDVAAGSATIQPDDTTAADSSAANPGGDTSASGITSQPVDEQRVSFVAVGDNLPDDEIGYYADACAGEAGDAVYDYSSLYTPIAPYIQAADLAYIKQETHLGGDDFGPRGWPSFNTTDAMADAVVVTGFDLVASASNHSYDWGYFGAVDHSRAVWAQQPIVFTGTAANEEQAQNIATIERNGIVFSLLDYTYGVNGFSQSELAPYSVNFIDEDRIRTDVARAHQISDVVLVAMHWGTENQTEPDDNQLYYAQLLADLEVDVVLGSHPHVINPLAWVEGSTGHKTLVAYSLGNFLSNHEYPLPENELGGMLGCDFVKTDSGVEIENIVWTPLVNHTGADTRAVYAVKDYTPELAAEHLFLGSLDDPIGWLKAASKEIVGEFTTDA